MRKYVLMPIHILSFAFLPCSLFVVIFLLLSLPTVNMKTSPATRPFMHDFRTGDQVRMKAGKYCDRTGVITKPTRQMTWVQFNNELGVLLVCLKHQRMEQYRQPSTSLQNATLIEDVTDEAPRGEVGVPMIQFEQLKQRVESLATRAELRELERVSIRVSAK